MSSLVVPTFVANPSQAPLVQSAQPSIVNVGNANCTIYLQNLNEKASIKKVCWDLQWRFSQYGPIAQIVAKKSLKMKGQAFVCFENVDSARRALEREQGRPLYGKPMVIRYAKFKSDYHSKRDCTYDEEHRKIDQDRQYRQSNPRPSRKHLLSWHTNQPATSTTTPLPSAKNKTLFVQNISPQDGDLVHLFSRYPGFVEVRLVPGRPDLAFVDYDTEEKASMAKSSVSSMTMNVNFAKK